MSTLPQPSQPSEERAESSFRDLAARCNLGDVTPQTIAFIDSGLQDYWKLSDSLVPTTETVILHAHQDGVEQITSLLMPNAYLDSVHIFAPGAPGGLKLGNTFLSVKTLERYRADLESWFALTQLCDRTPSLAIYGCDVAAGDVGNSFIRKLHELTGASIAASFSPVGHPALGANWNLERQMGEERPPWVLDSERLATYHATL